MKNYYHLHSSAIYCANEINRIHHVKKVICQYMIYHLLKSIHVCVLWIIKCNKDNEKLNKNPFNSYQRITVNKIKNISTTVPLLYNCMKL